MIIVKQSYNTFYQPNMETYTGATSWISVNDSLQRVYVLQTFYLNPF